MATVRQINNGKKQKAKKTPQITYKRFALHRVLKIFFNAEAYIVLNLFLNCEQK